MLTKKSILRSFLINKQYKLLVFSFFTLFSDISQASNNYLSDDELYQRGIDFRNQKKYHLATRYFEPLASKGNERAQHNLGMCFYHLRNDTQAYEWFKKASDQNFKPSQNNIKKLNLFNILLSDELVDHIASFLSSKDISALNSVSKRTHRIVTSLITSTNFLTSSCPYAQDFMVLFKDVTFEPQPHTIRVQKCAKVDKGTIEVHFRDPQHLRDIVEETASITPDGRLLFIENETVQDGQEIVAPYAPLETSYFINIKANNPLKLKGTLYPKIGLQFPKGSDLNDLSTHGKGIFFHTGSITSYEQAYQLAHALETFNQNLLIEGTNNLFNLFTRAANNSVTNSFSPQLSMICPNYKIISHSKIDEKFIRYVESKEPFIYVANNEKELKKLRLRLPDFHQSISFIRKNNIFNGVYCEGELYLRDGFKISSDTDLTLMGSFLIRDYNLLIKAKVDLWTFALNVKCNNLSMKSGRSLSILGMKSAAHANIKPDKLDDLIWTEVLNYYISNGTINQP